MPTSVDSTRRGGTRWAWYRRWSRPLGSGVLLLILLAILAACTTGDPQDTLEIRSDLNGKIYSLYSLVFWLAMAVFIIVEAMLLYSVVRFRRRSGDGLPNQIHGNNKLEIAWTIAPALLLVLVAVPTLRTIIDTNRFPAPGPDVVQVKVIGHQWWWEVQYPDLNITTANEIHLPLGKAAVFTLESADVQHSFWVPQMGGKMDVLPTRSNRMVFTPTAAGEYYGQCAELCGTSHANMRMRLIVHEGNDFNTWAQKEQAAAAAPTDQVRRGQQVFLRSACVGCHTIAGTNAQGNIAPNLSHFGGRTTLAAGILPNTPENLRRWIENPAAIKPGAKMPAFGELLKPEDLDALVVYLESLK